MTRILPRPHPDQAVHRNMQFGDPFFFFFLSKITVRLCDPAGRQAINESDIYSADVNNSDYLITAYFDLSTAQAKEQAVPRAMEVHGAGLRSGIWLWVTGASIHGKFPMCMCPSLHVRQLSHVLNKPYN